MCAVTVEDITLPADKVIRACNGLGIIGSEEPPAGGRDRQCGEPRFPSAYLRKSVTDRSDDHVPLRRFKAFPSLVGLGLATVPALVVHCQEGIRSGCNPDTPTGVSDHRDFRSASQLGGYGTLSIARRY
jgi:hypothetical protein